MKLRMFAALALTIGLLMVSPSPGQADSGDGSVSCNSGEICFFRYKTSRSYQKHFWYDANHHNATWYNVRDGRSTSLYIDFDANQLENRDSRCDVRVNNLYNRRSITIANHTGKKGLGPIANQNVYHKRVDCG